MIYNDMPITPIDYSRTIIYRIFSDDCDYVYVGSTTDFVRRKYNHKHNCNNETTCSYNLKVYEIIRENGGWDAFKMLEIEQYPCKNSKQAKKREQYWIDFYKATLNSRKSFGGETKQQYTKQYRDEHAEEINQYKIQYRIKHAQELSKKQREYYQEHKEQIKQKITCECGAIVSKDSLTKHKKSKKHLDAI